MLLVGGPSAIFRVHEFPQNLEAVFCFLPTQLSVLGQNYRPRRPVSHASTPSHGLNCLRCPPGRCAVSAFPLNPCARGGFFFSSFFFFLLFFFFLSFPLPSILSPSPRPARAKESKGDSPEQVWKRVPPPKKNKKNKKERTGKSSFPFPCHASLRLSRCWLYIDRKQEICSHGSGWLGETLSHSPLRQSKPRSLFVAFLPFKLWFFLSFFILSFRFPSIPLDKSVLVALAS
jgi:hypothetical protein